MSYEADMDSKLIEMVEQFPGLYDRSSPDYRNPESVSKMWEIISRKLKTPSMSGKFLVVVVLF